MDLIYPGDGRTPGFDKVNDLITFADGRGLFEKSGSWFYIKKERVANGLDALKKYLKENQEAYDAVSGAVELLVKKEQEAPAV